MTAAALEGAWRRLAQDGPRSLRDLVLLGFLTPLSWLYRLVSALKRHWFWSLPGTSTQVPARVLSVGNLTVGGSGKTPLAAVVARHAVDRGYATSILTRGYRARHRRPVTRAAEGGRLLAPPDEIGDEGILLAKKVPEAVLWVARRRALAAKAAVADGSEVLVLDDALQYWRLRRDADLITLDAEHPFGSGRIFPAGLLREPPSALRRATALILRQPGGNTPLDPPAVALAAPGIPRYAGRYRYKHWRTPSGQVVELAEGASRVRSACASIARPELFFEAVATLTHRSIPCLPCGDHHRHTRRALGELPHPIAMTEKDGPNLPEGYEGEVLLLVAEYEVVPLEGAPPFSELLDGILGKVET